MSKIKFGVIGMGHIGKRHASMVMLNDECELVAICDVLDENHLGIDEIDAHFDKFNPWFKWAIQYLQDVTFEDYKEALQEAEQTRAILNNIFDEVDIIITPSAIGEAPKELLEIPKYSFNHLWTLMYVPCVNLPFYLGTNGLPVGIQVIGAQNTDAQLLGYCKAIEIQMVNYFGTNQVSVLT